MYFIVSRWGWNTEVVFKGHGETPWSHTQNPHNTMDINEWMAAQDNNRFSQFAVFHSDYICLLMEDYRTMCLRWVDIRFFLFSFILQHLRRRHHLFLFLNQILNSAYYCTKHYLMLNLSPIVPKGSSALHITNSHSLRLAWILTNVGFLFFHSPFRN